MLDKLPPHNIELEQTLLATVFLHADDDLFTLSPADFYRQSHQLIYKTSKTLYQLNQTLEVTSVANELQKSGLLEKIGGGTYLSTILDSPPCIDPQYTINQIKGYADLRRMIELGNTIMKQCYQATPEQVAEIVDKFQRDSLAIGQVKADHFCELSDLTFEILDHCEELAKSSGITGIPTGYERLDLMLCGLQPTDLIILAARPGMGKTALALNIAKNAAMKGRKTDFYSLEMSRVQLGKRLLAMESRVNSQKFRNGNFSALDWEQINAAAERLHKWGIGIDDSPSASYQEIQKKARKRSKSNSPDLIIIDYLSFLDGDKGEGKVLEVQTITRGLKSLAKELNIPIILICQLNRLCDQRPNKRPMLSDLRDSGAIEQDADVVLFLYRDEVYYKDQSASPGIAEIEIAKQRNGPTGRIQLAWLSSFTRFENLTQEEVRQ